jgi:hypothetical protein
MIEQALRGGWAIAAATLMVSACTTLNVRSDVNTTVNVQCRSFAWAGNFQPKSGELQEVANPVNENRLRNAIQSNLATRGILLGTSPGQGECIVGYGIGVHNVVEGAYPWGWGFGGGWGWRHGYVGGAWWDGPYAFQEGVIAVDLYDARGRIPLWHASVEQDIHGLTGADADAKIGAAVSAIFSKFPATLAAR